MTIISQITKDKGMWIVLVLFVLACVFFSKFLLNLHGVVFNEYFSDIIMMFMPHKEFLREFLQMTGEFPRWNPYVLVGSPVTGNPFYLAWNPFNILYMLFQPESVFGLNFIVDVFLIGMLTYMFARACGRKRFGALVTAVIFMFSGAVVARVNAGHPMITDIFVFAVLSLLAIEKFVQTSDSLYAVVAGAAFGFEVLCGETQVALYAMLAASLYFALRTAAELLNGKKPRTLIKPVLLMIGAVAICVALSAVQILPSVGLLGMSSRSEMTYEQSIAYSFPPEQAITFLIPEAFGTYLDFTYWGARNFWELCVYTGVTSLVLAAVEIAVWKSDKSHYRTVFLVLLAFALLFALGGNFPLYALFFKFVPFFDIFRKPSMILFLASFSLAALAGMGADTVAGQLDPPRKRRAGSLIKLLAIGCVLALLATISVVAFKENILEIGKVVAVSKYKEFTSGVQTLPYDFDFYLGKLPTVYDHIFWGMAALTLLASISTALVWSRLNGKISYKVFVVAVLLLIVFDLWAFGMKYVNVIGTDTLFGKREIVDYILSMNMGHSRFLDMAKSMLPYVSMHYHIETLNGYESVQLSDFLDFVNYNFGSKESEIGYAFLPLDMNKIASNTRTLGLLNIKYVLSPEQLNSTRLVLKDNVSTTLYVKSLSNIEYTSNRGGYLPTDMNTTVYVYENPDVLPRAFVVRNALVVDHQSALRKLGESGFDPTQTVLLERVPGIPLSNGGSYAEAAITSYLPNEITVEAHLDTPGFLVLSENYHPDWKATDNGTPVDVYKADYTLRAIPLMPGEHTVRMVFEPESERVGLSITAITLISLVAFFLYRFKLHISK